MTDTDTQPDEDGQRWKAMSRQHEARSKQNLAALHEEQMRNHALEADLRLKEHEAATARAAKAATDVEVLKIAVANETGIPADLLSGNTREEILARAETVRDWAGRPAKPLFLGGGSYDANRTESAPRGNTLKLW